MRHVTLDALWRLGKMRAIVEYDMRNRNKNSLGAEYRRNLSYSSVFGGTSLPDSRNRIAANTDARVKAFLA